MIIGIMGVAGSGKDSLADIFVKNHGLCKIAFADVMKRFAVETLEFDDEQLWGPSENRNKIDPRYNMSPRTFLQQLGTNMGRAVYEDIWVDYALRISKKLLSSEIYRYSSTKGLYSVLNYGDSVHSLLSSTKHPSGVIFQDCRFWNEAKKIKEQGGHLIKIVRDGSGLSGENALHQSETEQESIPDQMFNFIVDNNGTLEDLEYEAQEIIKTIQYYEKATEKFKGVPITNLYAKEYEAQREKIKHESLNEIQEIIEKSLKLNQKELNELYLRVKELTKCEHRFDPEMIGGGCLICGMSSASIVKESLS